MSTIAIRPYVDKKPNMGLEKYDQVIMEGTSHKIPMWAKEDVSGSGMFRFITGLNEFAPELNKLELEEKEAKITNIRNAVIFLERTLASNHKLKVKDKDFWDNVILLKPDNVIFWNKFFVTPSNNEVFLDAEDPEDLIKIMSIEAGGFPEIAPNLEIAKSGQKKFRFYLDRLEQTIKTNTKKSISEARANAILIELFDNNPNKLIYICKSIDVNSAQYKKSTPNEVLFGNMTEFISGITPGVQGKVSGNAETFVKISNLDMETLKLRALVKDSTYYGFLVVRNGQIYEQGNETAMGYSIIEVVEFLKSPLNDAILQRLMKKVETYWNT